MEEKTLLKISLLVCLAGLLGLYFVSSGMNPAVSSNLDSVENEEEVMVKGVLSKVTDTDKVAFLEVSNEKIETVTVVLFKDSEINLVEGDYVEILGTVEEWKGDKEIIGNKVVKK